MQKAIENRDHLCCFSVYSNIKNILNKSHIMEYIYMDLL